MSLRVHRIDRTPVQLPFREIPGKHMIRELPEWEYFEITEVELDDGTVGYGETKLYYNWAETTDEAVNQVIGSDAFECLWDDSIGAGLQIALFDAVGRSLGVPIYQLLGERARERVPISWWAIDMPPEDWVHECETALEQGYTSAKLKARPWFDIREQLDRLSETLPASFELGLDFNKTLVDADQAIPLLQELEEYPQVTTFEEPIRQEYTEENRRIHEAISTNLAHHYGYTPPFEALKADVCDGYVIHGGASEMLDEGAVLETVDRPCWLQLVGSEITTAFCLQLGAVIEPATWPAVNCHQLHEPSLLNKPIKVRDGRVDISKKPGLGYTIDREAIEKYEVERPAEEPDPPRLIEVTWPDGPTMYFSDAQQLKTTAKNGDLPYFKRGVETRLVPNDGEEQWNALHERTLESPVVHN